jgi:hypothetical protein
VPGHGWLRTLVQPERYRGIDGTSAAFCDDVRDLVTYRDLLPEKWSTQNESRLS